MFELDRLREIAQSIAIEGGRALVVGGWVRDRLLNTSSKDIDVEVYGLPAGRLLSILSKYGSVNTVGEKFTVYKVGPLDIALPRTESKTGRGHKGFEVIGEPDLPLEVAFRRRDFTINAIGWDPIQDVYIDPYNGRVDLGEGLLRMVDRATFGDDSLRVLRAVQFAARFEFKMDAETAQLCRSTPLDDLPPERIWGEIEKLIIRAKRPSLGLALAKKIGVIEKLFPELEALIDCPQEPEWHPEGDVWTHNLLVVDEARTRIEDLAYPQQVAVMLGALCHDFGKPATTKIIKGRIRSLNHEEMGVPPATTFLDRLKIHRLHGYDVRAQVIGLVANHLKPGMWYTARDGVGDGAFRRLAAKVNLDLLGRLATSDCLGRTGTFDCSAMEWFEERAVALDVRHKPPEPILKGRHLIPLGTQPGPLMGVLLQQVYERQLDGEIRSLDEAVHEAKKLLRTVHKKTSK